MSKTDCNDMNSPLEDIKSLADDGDIFAKAMLKAALNRNPFAHYTKELKESVLEIKNKSLIAETAGVCRHTVTNFLNDVEGVTSLGVLKALWDACEKINGVNDE